jgi:branched-chain amino acid transport system substrate-binding protein
MIDGVVLLASLDAPISVMDGAMRLKLKTFVLCLLVLCWFSRPISATEPVNVAAIFSQTGIAAIHNAPLIPMLELAVEEINSRGGLLGHAVKLLLLDNQSTPIGSMKAAEEAVRRQVSAVIGAHWSSHSLAIAPILQEAGIPMISPGSTNPKVTQIGDYIFRVCFLDSFQGMAMARFAYTDLRARKAVLLKNIDEAYSLMLAEFFANSFRQSGGDVLMDGDYRGKAVDFAGLLEKVKRLKPDVLYIPGYTRDSGLLIRQAVSMGIHTTFLGGDAWDEIHDYAGSALDGSFQSAAWHPSVPFPGSTHLQKLYRNKYGTDIKNFSAPLAYDAFMLLADAVERAGTFDRARIRSALAQTRGFQGATGVITFNGSRDPQNKDVVILRWEKGIPKYLKTIQPES